MGKYAVIIGVNYTKNPEAALAGCCNDARIMVDLVKSKGFEEENIKLLIDDNDEYDSPNHVNVKNALNWLCKGREPGDIIFMHFSGHGTQIPADDDDEEADKLDEAICLEELFLMADDDLKQFFSQLPEGVKATVVMDCCHSGSMLDGTEVVIEGAKDADSAAPQQESDSLLSVLGGSREVSVNRSLPISTICNVMSSKLGTTVEPTGSGVNGAMAQVFGGDAGKLMMKFALSKFSKTDGGSSNPIVGVLGGLLAPKGSQSSGGNPLAALMGGGGGGGSGGSDPMSMLGGLMGGGSGGSAPSSNPLGSLMGGLMGGGGSTQSSGSDPLGSLMGGLMGGNDSQPSAPQQSSQNPLSMFTSAMGDLGLQTPEEHTGAPPYNPAHQGISRDVCTLITGCQANETSADVRPPGGDAFGALTKTLTSVYEANEDISYYDLVSGVRAELSKGGFKQNPCLECSQETAREPFIC